MHYIEEKLNDIASQHRLLVILFRSLNEDKVRKCVERLDNSLEIFKLTRDLEHTDLLARLEQQISAFYAQQQDALNTLQVTMDSVKGMLDKRLPAITTLTSSPSSPPRAVIPANTAIFYGRDSIVAELIGVITGGPRQHICLLGPGGMGKTAVSLAVMNHPEVEARFTSDLRVWVPCVKARSASLFVETLRSSLGMMSEFSGNPLGDILCTLKVSPPIVLLLDNFETPWNSDGGQSDVEEVLRSIHRIPHVTLFVTMRSSSLPCGDIPWHRIDIRSVAASASYDIYTSWHPEGRGDPGIAGLLELIGHMPLAVTLMAKFAASTGLSVAEVIVEYNSLGTAMLGQGLDSKSSMDVCIGLSVNSPLMKAHPSSLDLLSTIAMLPDGTSYAMLSKWWARGLVGALGVLRDTSLVDQRGSRYFVLPVIQRYILHPSRFSPHVRASMIESACSFLMAHSAVIGEDIFTTHYTAISVEGANLEAILLRATTPDRHVLRDGFLALARHQRHASPRVDIIERALTFASMIDDAELRGHILICYGDILFQLRHFGNALEKFKEALGIFQSILDKKKTAECRLKLAEVMDAHTSSAFPERLTLIMEAQEDSKIIGDEALAARCLLQFGRSYFIHGDFPTALSFLTQAEPMLVQAKDRYSHSICSRLLSRVYYQMQQYDLGRAWIMSAMGENSSIGDSTGSLYLANDQGQIKSACGDFEGALQSYLRCLEVGKMLGLPPLPQALEGMGLAWGKLGNTTDAYRAFTEALRQYTSAEPTYKIQCGIVRCQLFLRRLHDPNSEPTVEERSALSKYYSEGHIASLLAFP
ncbi:hypothetical protein H0H87_001548 [Tephrocybe sp. NHM501043]|nr:hypothetical protein H0H87_001548 [Tephrocybe sp. NHM501043]